jgi:hypothetical protein
MMRSRTQLSLSRLVRSALVLPALLLFTGSGCGDGKPPKYPLSGTITFDGKPIAEGSIMFIPSDRHSSTETAAIVDGKYAIELPVGQKLVMVEASRFIGPEDKAMGVRPRDQYLPDRYNVESKLTMEVKPQNDNIYDLKLQK